MKNEVQFVREMILDEKVSGEFMMSSGVQHAIVQLLLDSPNSLYTEENISRAIEATMIGLEKAEVAWSEFLISESIRGFIHGLCSLGLTPDDAAKISVQSMVQHLQDKSVDPEQYCRSIFIGVRHAAEDLGVQNWQLLRMLSYIPLDGIWNSDYGDLVKDKSEAELTDYLHNLTIKLRMNRINN